MRKRIVGLKRPRGRRAARAAVLSDLGFSQEWLDHVAVHQPSLFENPKAKLDGLRARGFSNPHKLVTAHPFILGITLENIDAKIKYLKESGFKDPIKLISTAPATLAASLENIHGKIDGLRQRGFKDPLSLVASQPSTLSFSFDNIDAKIKGLEKRELDPIRLITASPPILGLTFENIDAKIEGLRKRTFSNPQKLVMAQPCILGISLSNIDAKIEGLKNRGFRDPIKLITQAPATFSYSFGNIDRKIRLLSLLHGDRSKAVGEITALPTLLSYKWRRLLFAVRLTNPDGIRKLITRNPKLLLAAKGQTGSDNANRLIAAAKSIRSADADQLIDGLIEQNCLDHRLVRAFSRI